MKKPYFVFIFFIICGFSVFGNNDNQDEIDYLLFMPNSGNRFVDEEKAFIQLNNMARYLSNKNISPGQIIVYGYAASVPNGIKSVDLSRERAFTVIEELQKRGVSKELFADPVGYGSVYLWGGNVNEDDRKLNRRVRVLLDGESPIPITHEIETPKAETAKAETAKAEVAKAEVPKAEAPGTRGGNSVIEKPGRPRPSPTKKASYIFDWWILPVLAILFLFFLLLLLLKEMSRKQVQKTVIAEPPVSQMDVVPAFAAVPVAAAAVPAEAVTTWTVNLDDEIRFRAYELSLQRRVAGQCDGQGDYRDQDWYNAVREISARYKASGHSVFSDGGYWWASRSYSW